MHVKLGDKFTPADNKRFSNFILMMVKAGYIDQAVRVYLKDPDHGVVDCLPLEPPPEGKEFFDPNESVSSYSCEEAEDYGSEGGG